MQKTLKIIMKLSIIVPVYNEERLVKKTIDDILLTKINQIQKEIIVINDGSTDKTGRILKKYKNKIKLISHAHNLGKGASLREGFQVSRGDIVIVQDADGEYSPSEYTLLLEPFLSHNADVVYGSRFMGNRPHRVLYFWHYIANNALTTFSNMLTNLNLTDMETGCKVFRGKIIRDIAPRLVSARFGFEPEITARLSKIPNIRFYEVGISYWGRTYQEGKKIRAIDGIRALWEIIRFNLFI